MNWRQRWGALCLAWLAYNASADAEERGLSCVQVASLAAMAQANTSAELVRAGKTAGHSYIAKLTSAARSVQLSPTDAEAASAFLDLLPKNRLEASQWGTFGDSFCDHESIEQMRSLAAFGDSLARTAATAVLVAPNHMNAYVAASEFLASDPHSDYAVRMTPVCRERHAEFNRAVETLDPNVQAWFGTGVFDPLTCRALSLPEAE